MRPLFIFVLFVSTVSPRARASVDLSWRVKACVNRLTAARTPLFSRQKVSPATKHNRKVLATYQRQQDFAIIRYGINHSDLTRYITAIPELAEMFLERYPGRHQIDFVLNSGDQLLYAKDGVTLTKYPPLELLAVWRDSGLVFMTWPGRVLEEIVLRRTPEKLVVRALTHIKFDPDDEPDPKMSKNPL